MVSDAQCDEASLRRVLQRLQANGYDFVPPTPATHERVLRRSPRGASDLRDVFGWSRAFAPDIIPPDLLAELRAGRAVAEDGSGLRSLVRAARLEGMLFLHSAYPTAGADAVFFGPDTYRFARTIVQHRALCPAPVRRAVDLCCGAGPGAAVVASLWPDAAVCGADINQAALRLARVNAQSAGLAIDFRQSDLLTGFSGQFDLIVANPPYLRDPGERTYRHGGGALGAALSLKILDAAMERLDAGGTLLLYTGSAIVDGVDQFRRDSQSRLERSGVSWRYDEIDPDVFGEEIGQGAYAAADRIAAVLLTVTLS